jgi:hypothetical protein
MSRQILWSPEPGKCSQCSIETMIRAFTSGSSRTYFCQACWYDFIGSECTVPFGNWITEIIGCWPTDVDLVLEAALPNGTPQAVGWN